MTLRRIKSSRRYYLSWINYDIDSLEKNNLTHDIEDQFSSTEKLTRMFLFPTRRETFCVFKTNRRHIVVEKKKRTMKLVFIEDLEGLGRAEYTRMKPDLVKCQSDFLETVKEGKTLGDLINFALKYGRDLSERKSVPRFSTICKKRFESIKFVKIDCVTRDKLGWGYDILWSDLGQPNKVIYNLEYDNFWKTNNIYLEINKVEKYKIGTSSNEVMTVFEAKHRGSKSVYAVLTNNFYLIILRAPQLAKLSSVFRRTRLELQSASFARKGMTLRDLYSFLVDNHQRKKPQASNLVTGLCNEFERYPNKRHL